MGNLEKALNNIDTEELIKKDELETQKEINKILLFLYVLFYKRKNS